MIQRALIMMAVVLLSCSVAQSPAKKKGRWDDLPPPPPGQKRVFMDGIPVDFIPAPSPNVTDADKKKVLDSLSQPPVEHYANNSDMN